MTVKKNMSGWILLVAVLLPFFSLLADTHSPLYYDLNSLHYPYRFLAAKSLDEGRIPFWVTEIFCGFPLIAEGELGFFYPPNFISMLLLPPRQALNLTILLHLWLAAYFMTRFLRAIGCGRMPGLIAGAAFGLGGCITGHLQQLNMLHAIPWLPFMLWMSEGIIRRKGPLRYSLGLTAGVCMSFLGGHPQITFMSLCILPIYMIARSFQEYRRNERDAFCETKSEQRRLGAQRFSGAAIRILAQLALPFLLIFFGAVLAALQILPTLELISVSNRASGVGVEQFFSGGFPTRHFITLIYPFFFGKPIPICANTYFGAPFFGELCCYSGLIVLGFTAWSFSRKAAGPERIFRYVALSAFLLILGDKTPIYSLCRFLPGFGMFRIPARFLYLLTFSFAVLAAFGLNRLNRKEYPGRWWSTAGIAICIGVIVIQSVGFYCKTMLPDAVGALKRTASFPHDKAMAAADRLGAAWTDIPLHFWIPALLFLVVPLFFTLMSKGLIKRETVMIAVFVFVLLDLSLALSRSVPLAPKAQVPDGAKAASQIRMEKVWREHYPDGDVGPLRYHSLQRRFPPNLTSEQRRNLIEADTNAITGLDGAITVCSLRPAFLDGVAQSLGIGDDLHTRSEAEPDLKRSLRRLGVSFVTSYTAVSDPEFELVSDSPAYLYRFLNRRPRAFIETAQAANRKAKSDSGITAWHPERPDYLIPKIVRYEPHEAHVSVPAWPEKERRGRGDEPRRFLALADTFYPGWRASIDGKTLKIESLDGFRMTRVGRDGGTVIFRYKPFSFVLGLFLTCLGIALGTAVVAARFVQRKGNGNL